MAVNADSVVVDIFAKVDQATTDIKGFARTVEQSMSTVEKSAARAESAIVRQGNAVVQQSGRAANASRNLGRQIADIGTGLAGGQSPFLILAQQAPQVADALADAGGKAARVATFFAGPWGAALLAAGSIAGVLAGKIFDTGDAAKAAKPKIDEYAQALKALQNVPITGIDKNVESAQAQLLKTNLEIARIEGLRSVGAKGTTAQRRGVKDREARLAQLKIDRDTAMQSLALAKQATAYNDQVEQSEDAKREAQQKAEAQARKSAEEAVRHGKELQASLIATEKAFDPAAASAREFAKVLQDIADLRAAGLISPETAETYSNAARLARYAANDAADKVKNDKSDAAIGAILNRPGGITDAVSRSDAEIKERSDSRMKAELNVNNKLAADQEAKVRSLANLYEDAFLGGTGTIWDNFKREGIRAIALLLARFSVLQSTQGGSIFGNLGAAAGSVFGGSSGGGLFGSLASAASSFYGGGSSFGVSSSALSGLSSSSAVGASSFTNLAGTSFGRASGGFVAAGRMVRVNEGSSPGNVEGWRPQGSGEIIPLGRMKAARGGGTVINQTIHVDGRNSVTPAGFAQQIIGIAAQQAQVYAGAAAKSALAAAPGTMGRKQVLEQ